MLNLKCCVVGALAFGLLAACQTVETEAEAPSYKSDFETLDTPTSQCLKIEDAAIGKLPQTLVIGGVTVTIESWLAKGGSPGEYVGFTLSTTGGTATFTIKAGTGIFTGEGTSWVNPYGTSGRLAKAISNITFCTVATPPPPPPESCSATGCICVEDAQCASGWCKAGGRCAPSGGGVACTQHSDCLSNNCVNGACTDVNENTRAGAGASCTSNEECYSWSCVNGACEGQGVYESCRWFSNDCAEGLTCNWLCQPAAN